MTQIHIIDRQTDTVLEDIQADEFWDELRTRDLNGLDTFDFVTFADRVFSQYLKGEKGLVIPSREGGYAEFIIKENKQTGNRDRYIFSEGSFIEIAKKKIIEPGTYTGTPQQLINLTMNGIAKWKVGNVTYATVRTIQVEERVTAYQMLKLIAKAFEYELKFRIEVSKGMITRFVDLVEKIGAYRGHEIELGHNMESIERHENTRDIVTALNVFGPPDENGNRKHVFVYDDEAKARWSTDGEHLVEDYYPETLDQDITEERLITLGENELAKRVNAIVTYRVKMVDLEKEIGEEVHFGDEVRSKDEGFNPPLYLEGRIHTMREDLKGIIPTDVDFGDFVELSVEDAFSNFRKLQEEMAKKISEAQLEEYAEKKIPELMSPPDPNVYPKYIDISVSPPQMKLYDWDINDWTTVKGEDGVTTYSWRKYADDKNGNGMADSPEGKRYLGLAFNKTTPTGSNNPTDYTWSPLYDNVKVGGINIWKCTDYSKVKLEEIQSSYQYPSFSQLVLRNANWSSLQGSFIYGKDILSILSTIQGIKEHYFNPLGDNGEAYIQLKPNTEYTFSMWFYHGGGVSDVRFIVWGYDNNGSNRAVHQSVVASTTYHSQFKRLEWTFKTDDRINYQTRLYVGHDNNLALGSIVNFHLYQPQLEEGNVAAPWREAPEDTEARIEVAQTSADGKNTVFRQSSQPSTTNRKIGDLWFDTGNGNRMHVWTGSWILTKLDYQALSVGKLSAISADFGNMTAGDIKGVTMNLGNGKFIVDANGNVKFAGTLEGATGTFYGKLESSNGNAAVVLNPDGSIQLYDNSLRNIDPALRSELTFSSEEGIHGFTQYYASHLNSYVTSHYELSSHRIKISNQTALSTIGSFEVDVINEKINFNSRNIIDTVGDKARWKQSDRNYILQNSSGDLYYFKDGSQFASFTTKEAIKHGFLSMGNIGLKFLNSTSLQLQVRDAADTKYVMIVGDVNDVSARELKKNIEYYGGNALQEVLDMKIREYHYKEDEDWERKRVGVIVDEAPLEIINSAGNGVSAYAMASLGARAIQMFYTEYQAEIQALKNRIALLEGSE